MILLALDQSSHTTGYAIFEDKKLIESGTFTLNDDKVGKRLNKLRKRIIEFIDKYKVTEVAFEDIQLQNDKINNVATFKTLAEVFGVITELCEEINMPYQVIHSETWKSELNIKGQRRPEQKKNAQLFVANTYGKKVSEDESDAICIGTTYVRQHVNILDWS